ncbi:unnamed protein product, partial [Mesorhabditis spiculigera]
MRLAFLLLGLLAIAATARKTNFYKYQKRAENPDNNLAVIPNSTEYWFEVPIDHFAYGFGDTYKMRYEVNLDNYKPGGPIFFYVGNEGKIESFMSATGIMWDIAPMFNAAVIFAEHR